MHAVLAERTAIVILCGEPNPTASHACRPPRTRASLQLWTDASVSGFISVTRVTTGDARVIVGDAGADASRVVVGLPDAERE